MVSVVVGGQYGSEGKGKVALAWADKVNASAVVRVGGPNSGHTMYRNGKKYALRMLPVSSIREQGYSIIAAGSYIDLDVLMCEIDETGIEQSRLMIDPNAVIITSADKDLEETDGLRDTIASILSGTGSALKRRIARSTKVPVKMAKDIPEPQPYLADTKFVMRQMINRGEEIVIEGTQGYGLSVLHSKTYPYVTARDTSAAGALSEAGLSPLDVDHVILVLRTYPIRVGGNSGILKNEIDWGTVTKESGSTHDILEKTTVIHTVRRVARFDPDLVEDAIICNNPDVIVMNFMDYIDASASGSLSEKQLSWLKGVEKEIGRKISYYGDSTEGIKPVEG